MDLENEKCYFYLFWMQFFSKFTLPLSAYYLIISKHSDIFMINTLMQST
jgi:hypothetical protein